MGHDDFRPDNLTFERGDDGWHLHGVFDFGLTKLSSPVRELRHIAPMPTATQAAVAAYEETTGSKVCPRLLQFWAIGQAATAAAAFLVFNNPEGLAGRLQDLRQLVPGKDWSRLDDLVASMRTSKPRELWGR